MWYKRLLAFLKLGPKITAVDDIPHTFPPNEIPCLSYREARLLYDVGYRFTYSWVYMRSDYSYEQALYKQFVRTDVKYFRKFISSAPPVNIYFGKHKDPNEIHVSDKINGPWFPLPAPSKAELIHAVSQHFYDASILEWSSFLLVQYLVNVAKLEKVH